MKKKRKPPVEPMQDHAGRITDASHGERIYVTVAETVQTPMEFDYSKGSVPMLFRDPDAVSIRQPAGRLAAQAAHAASLARLAMARQAIGHVLKRPQGPPDEDEMDKVWTALAQPITTIILAARDSFELEHARRLLGQVPGVRVHAFHDVNEVAYQTSGKVMTAIATEPMLPAKTAGVIDYLPLWRPVGAVCSKGGR